MMTDIRGASNPAANRELAWNPAHPSWREGFRGIDEQVATIVFATPAVSKWIEDRIGWSIKRFVCTARPAPPSLPTSLADASAGSSCSNLRIAATSPARTANCSSTATWPSLGIRLPLSCALIVAQHARGRCVSLRTIHGCVRFRSTRFGDRLGQGFDESDHGVKSCFKRLGGALDLTQQKTSLNGRQGRESEVVRVGSRDKMSAVPHGTKAAADPGVPPLEPGRDVKSGLLVLVSEFAGQRSDRAATPALSLTLHLHYAVPPGPQPLDAVEVRE